MISYQTQSDDYLRYMILRGKQKENQNSSDTKFLPIFNSRNKNEYMIIILYIKNKLSGIKFD